MRTRSRRRSGWAAAGALAASALAPGVAQAQQTGLFPLAPIRRERVPCPMEDPVYRLYRNEYFGYHPTCWRPFPAGWGCPSPEAPNPARAFQIQPRDQPPPVEDIPGAESGAEGVAPPGGPAMPPAPGAPNPDNLPPIPRGGRSPFDLDTAPPGGTPNPADREVTPPGGTAPSGAPADAPRLDRPRAGETDLPPVTDPNTAVVPPGGGSVSAPRADAAVPEAGAEEPLLAVPDPTAPGAAPVAGAAMMQPTVPPGVAPPNAPIPAERVLAPQRTSVIGNLFSGRLFRRR